MSESNSTQVKLTNVRLSFPKLFKPEVHPNAAPGSDPKYSCSFIIDANTSEGAKLLKKVKAAAQAAISAKWPSKAPKFKDGNKGLFEAEEVDYYEELGEGFWIVKASDKRAPVIVDKRRQPVDETTAMREDLFYAGGVVNAIVNFWAYDNQSKGFNSNLKAVQWVKDGERFGAAPVDAEDVFEDLGDEDDWDDEDDDL